MKPGRSAPAGLPPAGLPGLDPSWSRIAETFSADGTPRRWHVLDNGVTDPVGTLLAVHGNPTWSYLWRGLLAGAPEGWRVVAPDHLGMGWSERVERPQRLVDRIADLGSLTDALGVRGPVVTVAHDWGGPISLGWALEHREQLAGIVLTNTAVSQPPGSPVPALIALARTPGVLRTVCVTTSAFVDGTLRLAHPALAADVRRAFRAPYAHADRRAAVGDFVADIPLAAGHPSMATLETLVGRLGELADVPALLLWGPRDPVFADRYLRDLAGRLPHAEVHRYDGAGHLLPEDRDVAEAVRAWLSRAEGHEAAAPEAAGRRPLWAALEERAQQDPGSPAVVELTGSRRTVTWGELEAATRELAAGLAADGVRPGDRVALLVPPGADLVAAVYACWRAGAVVVLADAGLGLRGLSRAVRGAAPTLVIGIPRALAAARALRWPGRRLEVRAGLAGLRARGRGAEPPSAPGADAIAAVLFTSGATGPAKGVVYTHGRLEAQRDAVATTYAVGPDDRLVAAFAPFALYGPAFGVASAVPDMDVTAPGSLRAAALADAAEAVEATLVFASPAALASVVASADLLTPSQRTALGRVRLLLSAGAPVPVALQQRVAELVPSASVRTPYGMTEALPVTDVSLDEVVAAAESHPDDLSGGGVCVGRPIDGVEVGIVPLDLLGRPEGDAVTKAHVTGEIVVTAGHVKERYDGLWLTHHGSTSGVSADPTRVHRTGDVGHLDEQGRLWVEGRLAHVVSTARGPVTPVGVEQLAERLAAVRRAAAVGVGPEGTQALVVVVEAAPGAGLAQGLAPAGLAAQVRGAVRPLAADVAAVLVVGTVPVDIRHNSKVDRTRLADWATRVLSGGRSGRP